MRRDEVNYLIVQTLAATELDLRQLIRELVDLVADLVVEHERLRRAYVRILTLAEDVRREAQRERSSLGGTRHGASGGARPGACRMMHASEIPGFAAEPRPRGAPQLASILHDVRAFILRYVVLTSEQAIAATLWTSMTHAIEAFDYVAYLQVTSATAESGKTRLLDVLKLLVRRPWFTGRLSAAVLVRKIDAEHPTLLLDESDAAFNGEKEYAEALRGILNTGYHRNGTASLCIGQGANIAYKDFSTFAPKAIAGIGKLPDTVASRAMQMQLRRRTKAEPIEKFRERDAAIDGAVIHQALVAWAGSEAMIDTLRTARPAMPAGLRDRAEDVIEPLLAIADLAGGEWPNTARKAIVALMGSVAEQDVQIELLHDIADVFEAAGGKFIATDELLKQLSEMDDRPWSTWSNGKPITGHKLAAILKGFGIVPKQNESGKKRGYYRDRFVDAWSRYPRIEVSNRQNTNNDGQKPASSQCQSDQASDDPQTQNTTTTTGFLDTLTLQSPVVEEPKGPSGSMPLDGGDDAGLL